MGIRQKSGVCAIAVAAVFAVGASTASAGEIAVGVTAGVDPKVVTFDTSAPSSTITSSPLTGMLTGELVRSIDQRPATGQIYAYTSVGRVLAIAAFDGAATQASDIDTGVFSPAGSIGVDFNPAVDRLRLVNTGDQNLRFNPITLDPVDTNLGTSVVDPDTNLAFDAGDVNAGDGPNVVDIAYDRNDNDPATGTTLFGVDSAQDILVRQGGVNGAPSPNGGLLFTIGSLGIDASSFVALDIAPGSSGGTGVGWAAVAPSGALGSDLHTLNLSTGAASASLGAIGAGRLAGLTIARGGGFLPTGLQVGAEGSSVAVRVERTGDTLLPASVRYQTIDRTAIAGQDYVPVQGTLEFVAGERTKEIVVPLIQDSAIDGAQVFAVELTSPTGGALVLSPITTVQILDDDVVSAKPQLLAAPSTPRSLAALRRSKRLNIEFACSQACAVQFSLSLGRSKLGSAQGALGAAGVGKATLRLTSSGLKALRRFKKRTAPLVLRSTTTGAAAKKTTMRVPLR
ncbi:MAG: DUF4394 domain-containing protein [Actinobacteria bacterium]|nr:DUF4394 domain-containing protein [Actinomycetota bacterium]